METDMQIKKKKNLIIFYVAIVGVLASFVCALIVVNTCNHYFKVLNKITIDNMRIEYGEPIPKTIDNYLDKDKIHGKFDDKEFFVNVKGKNTNNDYLLAGDYQLLLTYKNEKKTIGLTVEDKTKPKFTQFKDKVTITEGTKTDIEKLNSKNNYWKAEDKLAEGMTESAQVRIDGDYNLSKAGKYTVNIIAKDKNGLETKKPVTIEVISYEDAYKKGIQDKDNKEYEEYCKKVEEKKLKQNASSTSSSNITKTSGVKPNATINKQKQQASIVSSGKRVYFKDTTAIRNASDKFPEYKELCQFIYNFYTVNSSTFQYSLPVDKDTTEPQIENLLKEIYHYMFVNYDFYSNDISVFRRNHGDNYEMSITILPYLHDEYVEMKEMNQWIKNQGYSGLTENQVISRLNAYLRDKTNYDYSYADISYTVKGILYNKKAVCAGYAKFFKSVCDNLGISCKYISGTVDNGENVGSHAWNRVKIGNTWYYIDTCWNACLKSNAYYLSETLWSTHKIQ